MIIGIAGKIGSGKDTLAKFLKESLKSQQNEYSVEIYHFANNLKKITAILTGIPYEEMLTREVKQKRISFLNNITVRELLQKLGTDVLRNHLSQNIWTHSLLNTYKEHEKKIWIIADVRFRSEVEYIKNLNGVVVHIIGNHLDTISKHPSETDLDTYKDYDYACNNTLSLENLQFFSNTLTRCILNERR